MGTPKWINDPVKFRRFNGWATILWFVAAFPICILLSKSVPFLVFISVYAVVTGHLATWQAARVEEKQEEQGSTNFDKMGREVDEIQTRLDRANIGE